MNKSIKTLIVLGLCTNVMMGTAFAGSSNKTDEIKAKIDILKQMNSEDYDVERATAELYKQLQELKQNQIDNDETLNKLQDELSKEKAKNEALEKEKQTEVDELNKYLENVRAKDFEEEKPKIAPKVQYSAPVDATSDYLVNPMPAARINGYIQDAKNAQGNARMVFAYAPQQIYKIYCKIGYLTDLEFKKGEKITYVGGGDTAQWMLDKSTVSDTPHIYVKPIANDVATNIIVNTSAGHVYQILLSSGSWYNPMISWNYGDEDIINKNLANNTYEDNDIYPGGKNLAVRPENINFDYKIKAKKGNLPDWSPVSVFDDGKKTYIKFSTLNNKLPVLFIKEKDSKNLALANYRQKGNMFVVDKIFEEAQLNISNNDKDIIIIKKV